MAAARAAWRDGARTLRGEDLVFVDESGVATNMARLYGRALRGQRTAPCRSFQRIIASPHARAKREHFAAEREEMRYRQEAGELLVAVEVEGEVATILTELRTRLEALPDTLGPQLAPITDEQQVRTRLAEEIELALGEVARRMGGVA